MSILGEMAVGAANATIGQGLGMLFGKQQDKRQIKQQEKLTAIQEAANARQAKLSKDLQLEMWRDTNSSAQMKELEKAGLSPALMYGTSGGGGTTGSASAGSVSGGSADGAAAGTGVGMQLGMMMAQQRLMEAQTEKTQAEAEKIKGVDTELGQTQMEKVGAEAKLANIQAEIAGMTQSDAIKTISETATKAVAEAAQAVQKQIITEETMESQIEQIKTQAIGAMIENEAKRSGINLNEARIKEIATNIEQRWRGQEIDVENNKRMTEAMLWGAGIHAAGGLVNGIVNIAGKGVPNVVKQIK